MRPTIRHVLLVSGLAVIAGCTSGPDYQRPGASSAATWHEGDGWRQATPDELAARGPWWAVFNDPELDALEQQVAVSNQNLRAAEAAWRAASAALAGSSASRLPVVGVDAGVQRSGSGAMPASEAFGRGGGSQTRDVVSLEGTVSWTPDLWGRIRRTVESDSAAAQASGADLAAATLANQASLATLYVRLRAADEQRALLESTATANERALTITRHQLTAGVALRADVLQAEAQVAAVRAQAVAASITRAQAEHAIAVLVGKAPSELSIAVKPGLPALPTVPLVVPSQLLERRPDIAAAERRMAAANARIGVAQAAYYPDLTLSGALGFAGSSVGSLIKASNLVWSLGAQAGATLFDGGVRDAQVDAARAQWDEAVATYRQTVLTTFQQIEDQLVALRLLGEQAGYQQSAVTASAEAERVALNQYQAGTISYSGVILAQNTTRTNRLAALQIEADRAAAAVALIAGLGGGWVAQDPTTLPVKPAAQQADAH